MSFPIAVLVSGGGSNLQAMIDRVEEGVLGADIRLVVSNNPEAYGLERARKHGIPAHALNHVDFPDRGSHERAVMAAVREAGAEAVVLAGYMRFLSPLFVEGFRDRILNIHPALLPSFPGTHGQRDAAEYGVKLAGPTVHFVDEELDHGPIIIQAALPVVQGEDGDSLARRILRLEHRIYPQAVQWLASGRLTVKGRQVCLAPSGQVVADMGEAGECLVSPPLEQGF